MGTTRTRAILALALAAAMPAAAQEPPLPPNAPPNRAVALGPYPVTVEAAPGLPTHTLYRPTNLAAFAGGKLPIVAWGNGGCSKAGRGFEKFLTTIASNGYLVVVAGAIDAPLPRWERPPEGAPPPPMKPPETNAAQLIEGINWAVNQNRNSTSMLRGKLAATRIAVMGQSCGGLMALEASADPRVRTSVIWDSGVLPPMAGLPMLSKVTHDDLKRLHAPIAYFIGGPTDIAYANAERDFGLINRVPIFKGNLNVGHPGTFVQPNGGWFAEVGTAWLDWQLKGDRKAAAMFAGPQCGLCTDPAWQVQKKGL
jgi:predicted dienelactone hydrolase